MAQSKIINRWNFLTFARERYNKVQVAPFEDKETKAEYLAVVCTLKQPKVNPTTGKNEEYDFLHYSSKMPKQLHAKELAAQAKDLQVVELESGNYIICQQGESTWEEVDLGL